MPEARKAGEGPLVLTNGCDCHVHVFGPAARFPLDAKRKYTPADATVSGLRAHLRSLGLERVVIVQPSPYGTDNACTLAALAELGPMSRAVAVIGEDADLDALQRAGVRGARVNLETEGDRDIHKIQRTAQRVAAMGWHVQTFCRIDLLRDLPALPVPLVIDHFGLSDSASPLLALMKKRDVWVKLSAPHRLAVDARPIIQALAAAHPDRLVWGSDWPHVPRGRRSPERIEPYEKVDDAAALALLPANVREKILVENPARLYDF
ncbi:MAG: 2-pyrone-4,6-dicarboxylate lactonase [Betaproteobacteria bacterium]|jgi:predicted TIM-barrel fold metal-dependent hydrolase|nr:2-pyrone-4,6-dicarboxylate lactonase [Betaproteobacteria bacterium]